MPKKAIQLSDHFTYSRLLRFVLPCIGTMLFTSVYGIVDGLCVSNFVGKTAFAAVNLIMPLPQLLGTVGFMLGTGGSAIVGITLGEGDQKKADRYFTMFMWDPWAGNRDPCACPYGQQPLHRYPRTCSQIPCSA